MQTSASVMKRMADCETSSLRHKHKFTKFSLVLCHEWIHAQRYDDGKRKSNNYKLFDCLCRTFQCQMFNLSIGYRPYLGRISTVSRPVFYWIVAICFLQEGCTHIPCHGTGDRWQFQLSKFSFYSFLFKTVELHEEEATSNLFKSHCAHSVLWLCYYNRCNTT